MNTRTLVIMLPALLQGAGLLVLHELLAGSTQPFIRPYVFLPLYAVLFLYH